MASDHDNEPKLRGRSTSQRLARDAQDASGPACVQESPAGVPVRASPTSASVGKITFWDGRYVVFLGIGRGGHPAGLETYRFIDAGAGTTGRTRHQPRQHRSQRLRSAGSESSSLQPAVAR